MKKIVVIVLVLATMAACRLPFWPPKPTPTPTVALPTPTLILESTKTPTPPIFPTPTKLQPTPTVTKTVTPMPTFTPRPEIGVKTGYEPGWLYYRKGPGMGFYANWAAVGAVPENARLFFLGCDYGPYPWARVEYMGQPGWVYSPFTVPDLCSK